MEKPFDFTGFLKDFFFKSCFFFHNIDDLICGVSASLVFGCIFAETIKLDSPQKSDASSEISSLATKLFGLSLLKFVCTKISVKHLST